MSDSEDDSPLKIADNRESDEGDEEESSSEKEEVLASTSNEQGITKHRTSGGSVVCDSSDEMSGDSDSSDGEDDDEEGGPDDHHGSSLSQSKGESDCDSDSSEGPPGAETCAICLGRMRGEVGSPDSCEHIFCIDCILEWAKNNASCPQDRKEFSKVLVRSVLNGPVDREVPIDKKAASPEVFDENPTYCEVCNCSDREDRMLLCDGCDLGFHLECLTPPLDSVPIEEWFCPNCTAAGVPDTVSAAQPSTSQATEAPSSSNSSHRRTTSRRGERLIPRTRATERIRERITQTRKVQRRKQRKKEKRQRLKAKKRLKKRAKAIYQDGDIDAMRKDKENNDSQRMGPGFSFFGGEEDDIDPTYADDNYADSILCSSNPALFKPEDRKAHAVRALRESAFTPQASYCGRNPVLKQISMSNSSSESTDVLSGILENQFVLLSNSKNVALTDERKLVKRPGVSSDASSVFQEEKLSLKEKPLPSRQDKEEPNCSGGSGSQQEEHRTSSRTRSSPQRSNQRSPPSRSYRHYSRSPNHRHRSDEEASQYRSSNSEYRSPLDTHRSPLDSDRRPAHSSYQRRPSFSRRDGRHYRRSRSPDWRGRKYDNYRQYNHSPYRNRSPKRRSRSPYRRSRSPRGSSPYSSKSYRSQDRRMWSGDGYEDTSGSRGSSSDRHYRRDRSPGRRDRYHQDRHYRRDRSPYRHDRHSSRKSFGFRRSRSRSRERSGKSDKSVRRRTDSFSSSRSTTESTPQSIGLHSVHTMNIALPPKPESKIDQHLSKVETTHSSDKSRSGSPMSIDQSDDEDRKSVEQLIEEKQKLEKQLEKVDLFEQKKKDSSVERGRQTSRRSSHALSDDSSGDSDSSSSSDSREDYSYSKRSSYSSGSDVKEKSHKRREGSSERRRDSDKEKSKGKKSKKSSSLFSDDQSKSESASKKGKHKEDKEHRIERRRISLFGEYDDEEAELEIESYSNAKSKTSVVRAELSDGMDSPRSSSQGTEKSKRKEDSVKPKSKDKDKKLFEYSSLSSDYSSDDSIPKSSRKLYDSDFLSDSKSDKSKSYSKSKKDSKSKSKSKKWSEADSPPEESIKSKTTSYEKLSSEDSDLETEFDSRATKEGDRLMKCNMTPPKTEGSSSSRWDEKPRQKGSEIKLSDKLFDIDFKSILSDIQKIKNSKCSSEKHTELDMDKIPYDPVLESEEMFDSKLKDRKSNGKHSKPGKEMVDLNLSISETLKCESKEIKSSCSEPRTTETNKRGKTEGLYKADSKLSKAFDVKANRFYEPPSFKDDSSSSKYDKSKKKYDPVLKPSTDLFGEIMANVNKNRERSRSNLSCSSNESVKFAKSPGVDALFGDINDISEDSASLHHPPTVSSPVNNGEPDFLKLRKMNEEMFDTMNFSLLEDKVDSRWKEPPKVRKSSQEDKKPEMTFRMEEEEDEEVLRVDDNLRQKEEMENAEEMKRLLNRDHRISDGRRTSSEYSGDEKKDPSRSSSKKIDYKLSLGHKDPEMVKKIKQQKAVLEGKVVEEVKKWLDPYYRDKTINRLEYKEIVAKCVNKVVSAECGDVIEPVKMRALVQGYIKVHRYYRSKKESSIIAGGGSGVLSKMDQHMGSDS